MKYNLAIIGYGGMGSWHHNCIREKISELNVKGAYDIRPEIQQKIIQNGLHAYQNGREQETQIQDSIWFYTKGS